MSTEIGPLRRLLDETCQLDGSSLKDLTVLAVQNDPFRIDTAAGHRDGEWLATNLDRLVPAGRPIHLRGLHYVLATDAPDKPDGNPYRNADKDWRWLQERAADAARWLGYIPFDRIVDQRNAAPVVRERDPDQWRGAPWRFISARLHIDIEVPPAADLEPYVGIAGFHAEQPRRLVLIGEKSSLEPVLLPAANRYGADLYLPTGEMSDTLIHRIATDGKADGRPMVALYFADCDPAGHQMGISVARKLQAFQALGIGPEEWELHRVALTPDQVREYGLPSTPLKDTEKRADRWRAATGVEQTEIDALAALNRDLFARLTREAIECFYDSTLPARVSAAYARWREQAQPALDDAVDHELLEALESEANQRLAALREQVDGLRERIEQINEQVRLDASAVDLPPVPDIPAPDLNGRVHGVPLLDSRESFAEQSRRLIQSKAYGGAA
jgi:hypothetical protein